MKRAGVLLLAAALGWPSAAGAWGLVTHRTVAELAIDSLPPAFRAELAKRRQRVSDASVEPDTVRKRRFGRRETVRHFIDLDLYGTPPFAAVPRDRAAAVRALGREEAERRGTLPWTLLELHARMTKELRRGEWELAATTAGLAAHYVADGFMPLHTTADYDGVRAGSAGLHRAIEHELVDARIGDYRRAVLRRLRPAPAGRYDFDRILAGLREGYAAVPRLFAADRQARAVAEFRSGRYYAALDERLRDLLVERLAGAVAELGFFWKTAWDAAGRPAGPAGGSSVP